MSAPAADRNLLFGVLALQMDFVTRDQLIEAMGARALRKDTPLGDLLRERGALADDERALLDGLVEKHLARHGGDARRSLAAARVEDELRRELERIGNESVPQPAPCSSAIPADPREGEPARPPGKEDSLSQDILSTTGPGERPHCGAVAVPGWPVLPGYEIIGEVGRGGMGIVYKARHQRLERLVALKMIPGKQHDREAVDRFLAESRALARLQHPNVVQVFDAGVHEGAPYLALELVEGGTLFDQVNGNPMPPRDAARLLESIARAVEAVHQCNVIHRDLKPANILLPVGEPVPKVADFGLAKLTDSPDGTNARR